MVPIDLVLSKVRDIALTATTDGDFSAATYDQLAEEVMELHLALRGKHDDGPVIEWLEIASIAINALRQYPDLDVQMAWSVWQGRHGRGASRGK